MNPLLSKKGTSALHTLFVIGLVIGILCAFVSYMKKNGKADWEMPKSTNSAISGWHMPGGSPSGINRTNTLGVALRNVPIEKQGDLYYFDYRNTTIYRNYKAK